MIKLDNVLIIDDDIAVCESLKFAFQKKYNLSIANDPQTAKTLFMTHEIDVILLDLKLGNSDGMALFYELKAIEEGVVVIIMTAYGTIKSSIEAIKKGVFNYITKPLDLEEIEFNIEKGLEFKRLLTQINYLNEELKQRNEIDGIISKSPIMHKILQTVDKVKDIDTNILITGESGTGKERIAKAIHFQGKRKDNKFVAVNCSAIPSNLLESELFGHEAGAFSGAVKQKKGLFEIADQGSIFLDEIGEMDVVLQSKILRVIQEKEITPVGASKSKKVDVRIIAATNRSLDKSIQEGTFREDLFYRLNVINIHLPQLKDRKEDIPYLIEYFLKKYNQSLGKSVKRVTVDFLSSIQNYEFKGNIRELENVVERAIALSEKPYLDASDLPIHMRDHYKNMKIDEKMIPVFIGEKMKEIEERVIKKTYESCHFNQKVTGEVLGLSDRTIRNKLKEYGVSK